MKLTTYFRRAAKYIVQLVILLAIMMGIMMMLNKNMDSTTFIDVYFSQRGLLLLAVLVFFSLTYPFFGFTKKTLTFDVKKHAEDVDKVMEMCGFVKVSEDENIYTYRAKTISKKILTMYEDKVEIKEVDGVWVIEGYRKEVVKASMRFDTFISINQ